MQDIGIAFGCAAAAAVLLGTLVDGNTASGAFGAVFAAVIAVRERAHKREERKREEELRRRMEEPLGEAGQGDAAQTSSRSTQTGEVSESGGQGETGVPSSHPSTTRAEETSDADQADIPETEEPAERRAVRLELELLHEHASLPLADWRRVAIATVGSVLAVFALMIGFIVTLFIAGFGGGPAFLPALPALLAVGVLMAAGYWVGRTSHARGLLGPVVMGSIVGVSLPLAVLIVGDEFEDAGAMAGFALYALAFTGAGILIASLGGWLGARRRARG